MENFLTKLTQNAQKYKYFAIFMLIGVCFMVLSMPNTSETVVTVKEDFDVHEVEKQLEDILSKIDKVGDVSVMITTESGIKNVYATNLSEISNENSEQSSQNVQTEYVLISPSSGSQQPIKIYEIYPEYRGVLVVCEGANYSDVQLEILRAVRSLCGVSSENITISKMKE